MSSQSRDRVSDVCHAARERPAEERSAFLQEACDGNDALRKEVESLLQFEPTSARFLEQPAAAGLATIADGDHSMLKRQLGPYTIVAPLGAGGMGEVYRARQQVGARRRDQDPAVAAVATDLPGPGFIPLFVPKLNSAPRESADRLA